MTEREKIVEIVLDTEITGIKLRNITGGISTANVIADALLAANIGDVTEYKEIIRDLNTDVVAYRALSKADTLEQIIEGQKSLIDEYEHRAEVAERALRKAVSVLDAEYRAFGVNRENKTEQRIKNFIEQAEKELAEEI